MPKSKNATKLSYEVLINQWRHLKSLSAGLSEKGNTDFWYIPRLFAWHKASGYCASCVWERGQLSGRASDSWLKGHGINFQPERYKNFVLSRQLSVPTHFGICSTPMLC